MALKHHNPQKQRKDGSVSAKAPYNFIPLPERMVEAPTPLDQDSYALGLTGWIEGELETCSPTYIRGLLTEAQHTAHSQKDELEPQEKAEHAPFFAPGDERVEGKPKPVIPGSSLRGMTRALVEIIAHGRMRWVAASPTFTFRAVAAMNDDPLRDPYKDIIGNNATQVRAGYLEQRGDGWHIRPAMTQKEVGWADQNDQTVKVYDEDISSRDLPGFIHFNAQDYQPQFHHISFARGPQKRKSHWNRRGKPTRPSIDVGQPADNLGFSGVLTCAGNMLETADGQKKQIDSPRRKHVIVLPPTNNQKKVVKISAQAIADYRAGLTPFQKEALASHWGGGEWGCLRDGAPVFYVPPRRGEQGVTYFGHSPNFRIPARLAGSDRAATPLDFVSDPLLNAPNPDFADALFGWVEEEGAYPKEQRAGRLFFEDAEFTGAEAAVWYDREPVIPHVLAEPKPTTFQHYLVQNRQKRHDPDNKAKLAHYGTPPDQTEIRGYKLYWIKGRHPDIRANEKEREHESQLTRIVPLDAGVRFRFKIRFESLHKAELGALLWALSLPGEAGQRYCHRLGMGKPLGMGAVVLKNLRLSLTTRKERYEQLFDDDRWHTAARPAQPDDYLAAFEQHVLAALGYDETQQAQLRLAELERIRMLLEMLQWRERDDDWLEETRYMEIEHDRNGNEYTERPVLPDPLAVAGAQRKQPPRPAASPAAPALSAPPKQRAAAAPAPSSPPRPSKPAPASPPPARRSEPTPPPQTQPAEPATPEPEFVGDPLSKAEIETYMEKIERLNKEREEKERLRKKRKAEKKKRKKRK